MNPYIGLFIIRRTYCFEDQVTRVLNVNGYAGDAWICGLAHAHSADEAWELFKEGAAGVKRDDYSVSVVEPSSAPGVLMRAYGEY